MALAVLPEQYEAIVDESKVATLPWQVFFEGLSLGDSAGTIWTPTFVGLTSVGTPTITGVYFMLTAKLAYYRIVITPATNTSAVAGSTYCNNFPLNMTAQGMVTTLSGSTAALNASTPGDKRIYVATWTTITTPITITGMVEVS